METCVIIGLGKVGSAIGFLLRKAGYRIAAVVDPSEEARQRNIHYTGGIAFSAPDRITIDADCYLITTGDDHIAPACEALSGKLRSGAIVIHMSGAGGLDLLSAASARGALTGCIHPLQTFPDIESAIAAMPGTVFGVTADARLKAWAERFVDAVGGVPFFIEDHQRPLYHAAACIVSNYFVSLMYMAGELYRILGLDEGTARRAYWPLLTGTMNNLAARGSVAALTGPIARGDLGTLWKHLEAIRSDMPDLLPVYRELGRITADIALKKNSISLEEAEKIKSLLAKGEE